MEKVSSRVISKVCFTLLQNINFYDSKATKTEKGRQTAKRNRY
jgi:hypothetical protein